MKEKISMEQKLALQNPIRLKIMELLANQAMTLSQVAQKLKIPPANIAYHFRVLKNVKLIYLVEERDLKRNIEKYYLSAWMDYDAF